MGVSQAARRRRPISGSTSVPSAGWEEEEVSFWERTSRERERTRRRTSGDFLCKAEEEEERRDGGQRTKKS